MAYTKKTSHIQEGLANLISQFQGKPKIEAFLRILLGQVQDLENAYSDLLTETTIETAEGIHLDNIGAIVNEPRSGRADPDYRVAIRARIGLNTSEGTIEDVIGIALSVAGEQVGVTIREFFPASFILEIDTPIDTSVVDVTRLASFISAGRPTGVRGLLTYCQGTPFAYDGPNGTGFDEGEYCTTILASPEPAPIGP